MTTSDIGRKIKLLREEQGLTLEQVGDIVGVGKSTVRKWETGEIANMRRDKIASLAKALHTTPAYLMGWEEEYTLPEPPANPVFREPLKTAINLFQQLDNADQNKVIGRMETMLEDGKYQTKGKAQLKA